LAVAYSFGDYEFSPKQQDCTEFAFPRICESTQICSSESNLVRILTKNKNDVKVIFKKFLIVKNVKKVMIVKKKYTMEKNEKIQKNSTSFLLTATKLSYIIPPNRKNTLVTF